MNRRNRKILAFVVLIVLIGFISFNYFGPRMLIQLNGGLYSFFWPAQNDTVSIPGDYGLNAKDLSVKTLDGLTLSGYIIKSNTNIQKGTIILLHGIRSNKEHFLPLAKCLADSSFNSVLIDLRAHGDSEGKYCTYGFSEKIDVSILVDSIKGRADLSDNIGIWGQSLGGAIAIQSMATIPAIQYGIIESTFSDFNRVVHAYFKYYLGFDIPFLINYLVQRTRKITYFEPTDVQPFTYSWKIQQPVMVAHGSIDQKIPIDFGRENFNNMSSVDKEFIEVSGAGHLNLWQIGGEDYFRKIFTFLNERQATKE